MVPPKEGQDAQNTDSMIQAVLRKTAHVHHSKQSAERQEEVKKSFSELDTSGDGRISLEEFLKSTAEVVSKSGRHVISKIFSYVDEDKSGFLDFDEFLVVTFIMEAGFQICDNCLSPVLMAGYTCKTCWSQREDGSHDTYDLCSSCYFSDGFDHPASHELLDRCHMYHYLLTTSTSPLEDCTKKEDQVQCCVCEEYHTKDLNSLLVEQENHIAELEEPFSQKFACEWCASFICNQCARYFRDPRFNVACIGKWSKKDRYCGGCDEPGTMVPNVDLILEDLEKSEIYKKCSTCAENLKSGTFRSSQKSRHLITGQMATNLLLQQSYFNASMMASFGAAMSSLAG